MSCEILVTSAGTATAVNVIKALRREVEGLALLNAKIIASDQDPFAAGLHLADRSFLTPSIKNEEAFIHTLLDYANAAKRRGVLKHVLIPSYSAKIQVIAKYRTSLKSVGYLFMIPSLESINLCNNKLEFAHFLNNTNVLHPKTSAFEEWKMNLGIPFPIFLKPRTGSGSVGCFKVSSLDELTISDAIGSHYIVQEALQGIEYTVDTFFDQETKEFYCSARARLSVKSGQTVKAKTVSSAPFADKIKFLCDALELNGPSNFQWMQQPSGEVYLIEINPRMAAGGLMLTVESGLNIPWLIVRNLTGIEKEPILSLREGLYMSKYWSEVFWSETL